VQYGAAQQSSWQPSPQQTVGQQQQQQQPGYNTTTHGHPYQQTPGHYNKGSNEPRHPGTS